MSCAINGSISCFPKFLSEGIAAYFENNRSLANFTSEQSANLAYEQLIKLGYSEDNEKHNLLYQAGHAVVSYLQAKHPGLIDDYLTLHREANKKFLTYFRKKKLKKATKLLEKTLSDPNGVTTWLWEHSKESLKINQKTGDTVSQSQPLLVTPTEEEYFNKNFTVSSLNNIEVQCYYNELTSEQIKENEEAILAILEDFFIKFPDAKNASKNLETFKVYIFNNKEDFQKLGTKFLKCKEKFIEIASGGTLYLGTQQVHSKIFLHQLNKSELKYLFVDHLRHEVAHAMTNYFINNSCSYLPKFITEGIAVYFEKNYSLASFIPEKSAEFTYKKLMELDYSENKEQNNLVYQAGLAVVSYLQEKHPQLINQYLNLNREANNQPFFREEKLKQAEAILQEALQDHEKIATWLWEHRQESLEINQKLDKTVSQSQPLLVTPTEEEYFNNNFTISLLKYNIEVQCYYNELTLEQIKENRETILAVFEDFFVKFPDAKNISKNLEIFRISIFNNKKDFQNLGVEVLGFKKEFAARAFGGTCYMGTQEAHSEIFIYQQSEPEFKHLFLDNLRHEIAHALTNYAINGDCDHLPRFIVEGIANYFQKHYLLENFTPEQSAKFTYEELIKLSYSEDKEQHHLLYQAGYAIVSYLQEKHPKLINQYLIFHREANNQPLSRKEKLAQAEAILYGVLWDHKKIEAWLRERIKKSVENRQKNEIPLTLIQQMAGCNHFDRDAVVQLSQSTKKPTAIPTAVIQP